ncbi:MAG: cytochrome b/b6 domain-containing protein [Acidimicrobiia bacterium]|nr:cytochrome b/b6 domain-containing protein [Acidimicrobiia bacterium]
MSDVLERQAADVQADDRILRFGKADRIEHAVQVISFAGLGLTGLIQKFFESAISQWWIGFLGGLPQVRVIHRWLATILMLAVIWHFGKAGYRTYVERRPRAMVPSKRDWIAIKESVALLAGRRHEPVKQGRFTFAEKVEYWSFVWGTVLMIATGYMLWNPISTAKFLPGDFIPAAKAAHGGEAILAVLAILVWHIYHVHIKHFNRSIFTGYISRVEMIEEHGLELEAIEAGKSGPQATPAQMAERRRKFLLAFGVVAVLMMAGIYWFVSFEDTSIATIEPIEDVVAFKPLPPEFQNPSGPALSEDNPLPTIVIPDTTLPTETTVPQGEVTWATVGPLLADNCGTCHSASNSMGGLDLSSYEGALGSEGVVVTGDAAASSLVTVQEAGGHPGQLTAGDLALVTAWIDSGAAGDGATPTAALSWDGGIGATAALRCGACHSDTVALGGVDLSSLSNALASGDAILPGDAAGSTLITVQEAGGHPGAFTAAELATFKEWIGAGAP